MKKFIILTVMLACIGFAGAQKVIGLGYYQDGNTYNLDGLQLTVNSQYQQITIPTIIFFTNNGAELNNGDTIYGYVTFNGDSLFHYTIAVSNTLATDDTTYIGFNIPLQLTDIIEGNNTLCCGFDKVFRGGSMADITEDANCAVFSVTFDNSISEANKTQTIVYPNPSKDVVTFENVDNSDIYIYNTLGQLVKKVNNVMGKTQVNVSDLNNGVYIVRIQNGTDVQTKKIQIIK